MKKIIIFLVFIFSIFIGISAFASSNYFFNRYIATNIKDYNFSYDHVDGKLFNGFNIENLKYKGETLSSNVEFKFTPFKLIKGLVSIKKLHLIGVNKDVLEKVVNDFKPVDNNSSKTNIDIDFEFKDIILIMKPFNIDSIEIKRANIAIDSISYINSKFNLGYVYYETKSNIGDFDFNGKFKSRVLNIDKITLNDFDLNRVRSVLKKFKSDSNNTKQSINNSLIPKIINIKEASAKLKAFNIEGVSSKNLNLNANRVLFDVEKLLLNKANIKLKYNSENLDANISLSLNNRDLSINNLDINGKNLNKLEYSIKKLNLNIDSNKSDNNIKLLYIDRIKIKRAKLNIDKYKYKNELINNLTLKLQNSFYNLKSDNISAKFIKLSLKSNLVNLFLIGKVDKTITVNLLKSKISSIDKLLKLIPKSNSANNTNLNLSKDILVKSLQIDAKKMTFEPFVINNLKAIGSNIKADLKKLNLKSGNLKLNAKSNFGSAKLTGNLKGNNYYAKGSYNPSQYLLDKYKVPLKAKNINQMKLSGVFGLTKLKIDTTLSGKDILKNLKNFSILSSKNIINYNYISGDVDWSIDAKIDSLYTKKAELKNRLIYLNSKDILKYEGVLRPKEDIIDNIKISKLFKNLELKFNGGYNNIKVNFKSDRLHGNFLSDYNSGKLLIVNNSTLELNNYINMGLAYKEVKISDLKVTSNINFNKPLPLNGKLLIDSKLLKLSGNWVYKDSFSANIDTQIPRESLLLGKNKKLIYKNIKNFKTKLELNNKFIKLDIKNPYIYGTINYTFLEDYINSNIKIGSILLDVNGKSNDINIKLKPTSIKQAISSIKSIYKLDNNINLLGSISCDAKFLNNSKLTFLIKSPKITYKDKKKSTIIENINLQGEYINSILNIKRYNFTANSYKIYSNKSSIINFYNNKELKVKSLWINDSLILNGLYKINQNSGEFIVKSNRLKLENRDGKVILGINGKLNLIGNKKYFNGKIDIIDGLIKSTIARKNLADNSDIVILQRKRKKESTEFAKNIKLNLTINSLKGIQYLGDGANFRLIPKIKINKNYNALSKFIGTIIIAKDGYYKLNGKKLRVLKGKIVFSGKSSSPNINIQMGYRGRDYNIKIHITGTPTRPMLFFSSNPPLTKEQILSYLLFDDSSAVGTHSKEAMLNMIGGSLAKSLLGSIGIKIDHISVKENGFSIGKSIGKRAIIYYNQDKDHASIKTKIDITKHIHSIIEVGKDKQSADLIFTKEY